MSDYKLLISLDRDGRDPDSDRPDGHAFPPMPKQKKPVVSNMPMGCYRCKSPFGKGVCKICLDALSERVAKRLEVIEAT